MGVATRVEPLAARLEVNVWLPALWPALLQAFLLNLGITCLGEDRALARRIQDALEVQQAQLLDDVVHDQVVFED